MNNPGPPKLHLSLSMSVTVTTEEEAKTLYEIIKTFIRGVRADSMVSGALSKMMEKCCGDKNP
jgi:hypothetical protein